MILYFYLEPNINNHVLLENLIRLTTAQKWPVYNWTVWDTASWFLASCTVHFTWSLSTSLLILHFNWGKEVLILCSTLLKNDAVQEAFDVDQVSFVSD